MKKIHGKNPITTKFTERQKEVLKLLQKNGVLIKNKNDIFVANGNDKKKVTPKVFYTLVNKGLVLNENKSSFDYVLSTTGKIIKV